jgi:hypothetical protein
MDASYAKILADTDVAIAKLEAMKTEAEAKEKAWLATAPPELDEELLAWLGRMLADERQGLIDELRTKRAMLAARVAEIDALEAKEAGHG